MVLGVSLVAAYLIVFLSLLAFTVLAISASGWKLSSVLYPKENYLSARSSHGWFTLGLSLYASAVGNWVLYQFPYVGATGGWPSTVAYSVACVVAMALVACCGPSVRRLMLPNEGFTSADYLGQRFGCVVQYCTTLLSLLAMTVALVAELTCIAATLSALTAGQYPAEAAVIPVAVVTLLYTAYAGLPASICTDKFQGIVLVLLLCVIIPTALICANISPAQWRVASKVEGSANWWCAASLFLGVSFCEVVNQGSWQRVYAARSVKSLTRAYVFAMLLVLPSDFLLGVCGVAGRAKFPSELESGEFLNSVFFYLLLDLSPIVQGLVAVLAMCLVASSVDSLQSGLASLIGQHLVSHSLSMNWARLFTVLVNLPAIVVAVQGLDVMQLFMVANTLTLAVAPPMLLSLSHRTTNKGAIAGYFCGTLAVLVYGWCATGDFLDGLKFCYQQKVDTPEYTGMLLAVLLSSTVACGGVSLLDGYRSPAVWQAELARRDQLRQRHQDLAAVDTSSSSSSSPTVSPEKPDVDERPCRLEEGRGGIQKMLWFKRLQTATTCDVIEEVNNCETVDNTKQPLADRSDAEETDGGEGQLVSDDPKKTTCQCEPSSTDALLNKGPTEASLLPLYGAAA